MSTHLRPRAAARAAAVAALALLALPPAVRAQDVSSPVTIHGFLSQGFARSNRESLYGIDSTATTDYRAAALQIRYAISEADNFLVQFSHRRMGGSLLNEAQPEVALDWIFYQRQVLGAVVKLGRVPMPRGIYNEVRDVGTILPFYRAPYAFYTEGVETIDGGVGRYTHGLGAGFSLDMSAFIGGWDWRQLTFSTSTGSMQLSQERAERAIGGQLWLNTPMTGTRLGLGGQSTRFRRFGILTNINGERPEDAILWAASLDATRERYFVRSEYGMFQVDGDNFKYPVWYAQGGIKLFGRLGLNGQVEQSDIRQALRVAPTTIINLDYDYIRDQALGATFSVTPSFVLKLEAHDSKGYNFDRFVSPVGPQAKTRYWISSASVSF